MAKAAEENQRAILPIVVTLTALLGIYVGSYYATVQPIRAQRYVLVKGAYSPTPTFLATYSRWGNWFTPLFAPIHRLDRILRLGTDTVSERRKAGFVLPVIVTLAVIVGVYVSAYFWLVDVNYLPTWGNTPHAVAYYGKRFDDDWGVSELLTPFFAPMNWIDRWLRPEKWRDMPAPFEWDRLIQSRARR